METKIHPDTGEVLTRQVRRQTIRYGSYVTDVDQPGWYPKGDGDALFDMKDLSQIDTAFQQLRDRYIGHLKEFRSKLKLTQQAASRLIGGGPRAFQKYENGRAQPTEAAAKLIEVLWRHPELLSEVEATKYQGLAA